jgi:hypothetical protein
MKKLKSKLATLAVLAALTFAFAPMKIVRADDTGGQGTSDSQKKGTTSSSSSEAAALLALILRLLGW